MNILITGASGLVGSRVAEMLKTNPEWNILIPSSAYLPIDKTEVINSYIQQTKPDVIIHAAAMTNVTAAENERNNKQGPTWKLNIDGAQNIANACETAAAFMIHISTDMVFSGSHEDRGPYRENKLAETDPNKLCWYGCTKAEAERVVLSTINPDRRAIIRISNPVRKQFDRKPDYIQKILQSYDNGKLFPLFGDQFLTLTYIDEISICIKKIIERNLAGTFHVSSSNSFTPYEFGNYLIEKARGVKNAVQKGSIEEFIRKSGSAGRYPHYGGLSVTETEKKLHHKFMNWKQIVDTILA